MSRTKQRRQSMFDLGKEDALGMRGRRWSRNPLKKAYDAGYYSGIKQLAELDELTVLPIRLRKLSGG